jgi:tetratricopeptide (TPR) repeat protein
MRSLKCFLVVTAVLLIGIGVSVLNVGCAKKQTAPPVNVGQQLFDEGNFDEARTYYEGLLAKDSTDVDAVIYMTRIALNQDDYNTAIEWAEKGLELAPDSSKTHYWAATAYVVKVQRENAIMLVDKVKSHIEKAVELDPSNVEARTFLAMFLVNAPPMVGGSREKAKEQAAELMKYDAYQGHLLMAQISAVEKDYDKAAGEFEAAAQMKPEDPDPYYRMGMMYQQTQEWDKAFAALEKALVTDPDARSALYQIGRTGVLSGENLDRAIECLQLYLEREPESNAPTWANAHWRLGMLYEEQGKVDAARKEYEAALALDPEDKNAKGALEKLDAASDE